jgi:uncharacterized protein YfaS (alpha-2-macroglobulin family)
LLWKKSKSAEAGYEQIPNVAIVDALPAGFEVENPHLSTSVKTEPVAGAEHHESIAEHLEFLDDRVVLFTKSQQYQQTFHYSIRAITTGRFVAPPIQASCMYDEGISSIHGGGIVEVKK